MNTETEGTKTMDIWEISLYCEEVIIFGSATIAPFGDASSSTLLPGIHTPLVVLNF
jgi:hypothetical protein